jgi:hypothetical protein
MLTLDNEITTDSREFKNGIIRETKIGRNFRVEEYQSKSSDYRSIEVNSFDVDFDTIKTKNRTITLGSQEKVKIRTISLKDSEGVNHEINLFSERF